MLLPGDLLHLAVEWWHTELDAPAAIPLCLNYRVVVRSLDRMRQPHRRRVWTQRWDSLWQDPSHHRVHWGRSDSRPELGVWAARLNEDHHLTTVVLGSSVEDDAGGEELQSALNAGIPVILWDHRPGAMNGEMAALLDVLAAEQPEDLVDRVYALRKSAGQLDPDDQAHHPGRHLAVLWDDPDRNVYDTGVQP